MDAPYLPANVLSLYTVIVVFLPRHLGGALERIGADLAGSRLNVIHGGGEFSGVVKSLSAGKRSGRRAGRRAGNR